MAKRAWLVISGVAVLSTACSGRVGSEGLEPRASSTQAALEPGCVQAAASEGWVTGALGAHSGTFTLDVELGAGTSPSDELFGLSDGAASTYTALASIVRLNPSGFVDVRNGGSYAADQPLSYAADFPVQLSLEVDPVAHRYTVRQGYTVLASNYAFRTEQAATSSLDHFALKVDSGGPISACNMSITDGCRTAAPSGGFVNDSIATERVFFTSTFRATPSANGIDGVAGLSAAPAVSFNDLAVAVRFNPEGFIDARNGATYAADASIPYSAGTSYDVQLLTDVVGHRYSVLVNGNVLARDYAFRSQQASVTSLGNWALVADSAVGSLGVCGFRALPARSASYIHDNGAYAASDLAAAADGTLLLANATQTVVLDGTGQRIGSISHGGTPAEDAHGDLYLAGTFSGSYDAGAGPMPANGGQDVYLSKYDAAHRLLWSKVLGTNANDDSFDGLDVNAEGDVVASAGDNLHRFDANGTLVFTWFKPGPFAIDPSGGVIALGSASPGFTITRTMPHGDTLWTQTFNSSGASFRFLRSDASGNAFLAGTLNGQIDFGTATLTARSSEEQQVFVAKLDAATGVYQWGAIANMNVIRDLAVDASGGPVLSGYHDNGFRYELDRFDASGASVLALNGQNLLPDLALGFGNQVAVDPSGGVYWQFSVLDRGTNLPLLARLAAAAP